MTPAAARRRPGGRLRRGVLSGAIVIVLGTLLAHGFTVVPDALVAKTDLAGNPTFVAKDYVQSLWASQVLPYIQDRSADLAVVLAAIDKDRDAAGAQYGHRPKSGDGPWNFVVHGVGIVKAADTGLRHATVTVDVDGHDVVVQLGPVIFGTGLRDALPFISFDQVTNQIQFAQVSRELNDRASAAIHVSLDVATLVPGNHVAFAGAMVAGSPPQLTATRFTLVP